MRFFTPALVPQFFLIHKLDIYNICKSLKYW